MNSTDERPAQPDAGFSAARIPYWGSPAATPAFVKFQTADRVSAIAVVAEEMQSVHDPVQRKKLPFLSRPLRGGQKPA